jgi:hypothetical protein
METARNEAIMILEALTQLKWREFRTPTSIYINVHNPKYRYRTAGMARWRDMCAKLPVLSSATLGEWIQTRNPDLRPEHMAFLRRHVIWDCDRRGETVATYLVFHINAEGIQSLQTLVNVCMTRKVFLQRNLLQYPDQLDLNSEEGKVLQEVARMAPDMFHELLQFF